MGSTELQLIADILSGLGDTTVTGIIWFLGYGIIKQLIYAGIVLIIVYAAYKVIMRMINQASVEGKIKTLAALCDIEWREGCDTANYKKVQDEVRYAVTEHEKNVSSLKTAYADISVYTKRIDSQDEEIDKLKLRIDVRDKMLEECREEVIALEERRTKEAQSAQEAKEQRDSYQAALLHIEGEPTNGEANVQGQEEGSKQSD